MKKLLAVLLTLTMLVTLPAFGASADNVVGGETGVEVGGFPDDTSSGKDLNVKVTQVTHKYAVDVDFTVADITLGTITWNAKTLKYELDASATMPKDFEQTITVSNRSDLPVDAYVGASDDNNDDYIGIAVADAKGNSADNKLTVAKATPGSNTAGGSATPGEIKVKITSSDWQSVINYYATKEGQDWTTTQSVKYATVTVYISKAN